MSADSVKAKMIASVVEWTARSLIVEFKCGLSTISGLCSITVVSDKALRLRLATPAYASCEMEISLTEPLLSFSVRSFEEASESILKPAIDDFRAEVGQMYTAEIVEQVADLRFAEGSVLLIGVLKNRADPSLPFSPLLS